MPEIPSAGDVKDRLAKAAEAVKTAAVEVKTVVVEEARQMRKDEGDAAALKADAKHAAKRLGAVAKKAAKKVKRAVATKAAAKKVKRARAAKPARRAARKGAKKTAKRRAKR